MEKKLQNMYPTDNNFLIAQDLWQAYYQILSIIFLNEFTKLNVDMDTMIKNVKHVEYYGDCFFEYTSFKDDLIKYKCLCCYENYK